MTTHPFDKVDDLIHSGVTGDPLVNVGDNVHTDVTQEVLGLDIHGGLAHANEAHNGKDGLVHGDDVDVFLVLQLTG